MTEVQGTSSEQGLAAQLPESLQSRYRVTGSRSNGRGELILELEDSSDGARLEALVLDRFPNFMRKQIPDIRFESNRIVSEATSYNEDGSKAVVVYQPAGVPSLLDRLSNGQVWPTRAAYLVLQHLVKAIQPLHQQGIGVGDIGPERIFVTSDLDTAVLLHGLSCSYATLFGRSVYVDPRDDVASLAAMMVWMLTGSRVTDTSFDEQGNLRAPGLSEALKQVFQRGMDPQRNRRYKTAEALLKAVQLALVAPFQPESVKTLRSEHRKFDFPLQKKPNKGLVLDIVLCMLIALGIQIGFLTQRLQANISTDVRFVVDTDPEGADVQAHFPDGRVEEWGKTPIDRKVRFTPQAQTARLMVTRPGYVRSVVEIKDNTPDVKLPVLPAGRLFLEARVDLGPYRDEEPEEVAAAEESGAEVEEPASPRVTAASIRPLFLQSQLFIDQSEFLYRPAEWGQSHFETPMSRFWVALADFEKALDNLFGKLHYDVLKYGAFAIVNFGGWLLIALLLGHYVSGYARKTRITNEALDAYEAGDYTKAEDLFQQALEFDFLDQNIVFYQALCAWRKEEYEKALEKFRSVIDDFGHSDAATATASLFFIAQCFFWLGNYTRASQFYERYLHHEVDSVIAMFNLAQSSFFDSDLPHARRWFKRALQKDPELAVAREYLERIEQIAVQSKLPFLKEGAEGEDRYRRRMQRSGYRRRTLLGGSGDTGYKY